jgi:hypothetical protein
MPANIRAQNASHLLVLIAATLSHVQLPEIDSKKLCLVAA